MDKKRHYYLDYIRVAAMIFVVFMHSASNGLRYNTAAPGENWHLLNLCTSLAFTAVPLFFMMSGFLLFTSPKTADPLYLLRHRLPRLAVPLLSWSALCGAWYSFRSQAGFSLADTGRRLLSSLNEPAMTHLWFMYTLLGMYLLSPLFYGGLNALDKKGRVYLAGLLTVCMTFATLGGVLPALRPWLPQGVTGHVLLFSGHFFALIFGWLLGTWQKPPASRWLLGIALADLALITVMTWRRTVGSGAYDQLFQTQNRGFELLLAVCVFLLCRRHLNRPFGRLHSLVRPLSALCFPIYMAHGLALSILRALGMPDLSALQVAALTLSALAFSWLVTKTLASVRPLCFLFTGMTYEEARSTCSWQHTAAQLKK